MVFWTIQILNGISLGMLLFLLAVGLTMIFGLMRIINLAQGSFYLFGAYLGVTVMKTTGNFLLALMTSGIAITLLSLGTFRWLLHRFQKEQLSQVLLTFGLLFFFGDLALWIWGPKPQAIPKPLLLSGALQWGPISYPKYRLAIIIIGLIIAGFLGWFQERTRLGAMARACVDDNEMADSVGVNVPLVMTVVFCIGGFLAGISGVLGAAILGVYPGVDFQVLLLAFIVVIIGGTGSLKGAFIAGILIGLLDNIGKVLFPELSMFTLFVPMTIILAVRPTGLFGRK
jgi:branched-chain amino acid transport system permease protein